MSNREEIEKAIAVDEYTIGCFDDKIEDLDRRALGKVIEASLSNEYTDIDIEIDGLPYVVELSTVGNEKDYSVLSKQAYINRYQNEHFDD